MNQPAIIERLGRELLFFDGAMGSMLQQAGLPQGTLPERWNVDNPEAVLAIHAAYAAAGCHILKSNTFGANRLKCGEEAPQLIEAGVALARRAVRESGRPDMAVFMDIGPTGKLLAPLGDLAFEDAVSLFAEMAAAGARAGADGILIETMSDTYEMKAAVLGAKEATRLPVIATLIFGENGRLLTGGDVPAAVALLEGLGVDAIGVNCGMGPEQMLALLPALLSCASVPVAVNPNAGLPRSEGGEVHYDVTPAQFADVMEKIVREGAWLAGGCCGTTPAHLAAMAARCRGLTPPALTPKRRTVMASYAGAVTFGGAPVVIGGGIRPGRPMVEQALREGDMDTLVDEGLDEQDSGVQVLAVGAGLPGVEESVRLPQAVGALQGMLRLPLLLEAADPDALEKAMRVYNGKSLVRLAAGGREAAERLFPLVKRYGGVAVAAAMDENGVPQTAEGRLRIAERLREEAVRCGIGAENLLIDPLGPTPGTGPDAETTLETLRRVKRELGLKTLLDITALSAALTPEAAAALGAAALQEGVDAVIADPNDEAGRQVMAAVRARAEA